LYLPECWLNDTARLDAVEVPTELLQTEVFEFPEFRTYVSAR
jgi:hypothetical protein